MNTSKKYLIAADIVTTAPLHITAIEPGSYDPKTQFVHRYAGPGIGCSLTRTMALLAGARVGLNGKMIVPRVPVIPASTVAGKMRRAAADLIFESLVKRNLQLSVNAYNTMTTGMATTDLKASDATPETMRAARQEPFLSNFGGTSFALSAGSVISEGWPLLELTRDLMRSEPIADVAAFTELNDMTDAVAIIKKNDVGDMKGKYLEGVVGLDNIIKYAASESDTRVTSKAKKDAGVEDKKVDLRTFNAVEVVRPGMGFALRIEVTARSPAHLGLMLMALQKVLQNGQFGGKAARGLGTFTCNASRLYEIDPSNRQQTILSSVFGDKSSGYEFADAPVVNESTMAAQDYLDAINPLMLEAFASTDAKTIKTLLTGDQDAGRAAKSAKKGEENAVDAR